MTDEDIVHLADDLVSDAQTYNTGNVDQQRSRAERAYNMTYPPQMAEGTSIYVSGAVHDAVQSPLGKLMWAFTEASKPVYFKPENDETAALAQFKTDRANQILMQDNEGYFVIHDALHDGLKSKNGYIYRAIEERMEKQRHQFSGMDGQSLEMLLADPANELEAVEQDSAQVITPDGMLIQAETYSGVIVRREVVREIVIKAIAPEDVLKARDHADIKDSHFVSIRFRKTRGDLLAMGYAWSDIQGIRRTDTTTNTTTKTARDSSDRYGESGYNWTNEPDIRERVYIRKSYLRVDVDGDGILELIEVVHGDTEGGSSQLLGWTEVDEIALEDWSPIRQPHKPYGLSEADVSMDSHLAMTELVRGSLECTTRANFPDEYYRPEAFDDPSMIADTNVGRKIPVNDLAASAPRARPEMSQMTIPTMEMVQQQLEAKTGITRTAKGLNPDAVSKQNAANMVEMYAAKGEQRVAVMARNFAHGCLIPLYRAIDRMADELEGAPPIPMPLEASLALTREERQRQAQTMLGLDAQLNNPETGVGLMYPTQNRYAVISEALEMMGYSKDLFLLNPQSPEYQQAEMMQAQQQQQAMEMQMQQQMIPLQLQMEAQANELRQRTIEAMQKSAVEQEKIDLKEYELNLKAFDMQQDNERDDSEQQRKWLQTRAELEIEQEQERPVDIG